MLETSNPIARRRLILISITLATIPCYCIGAIAILLAPVPSGPATPTATWTATEPLQILTPDPSIFTATPSNTPTVTVTPSPTATYTPTMTPSTTGTWTFTPTLTSTFTASPTFTASITLTPSETFTPSPTLTPVTPSATPTASITSFPSP